MKTSTNTEQKRKGLGCLGIFIVYSFMQISFFCTSSAASCQNGEKWQTFVVVPEQISVKYTNEDQLKAMEKALKVGFIDKTRLRSFGFLSFKEDNQWKDRLKIKITSILQRAQLILGMHLKNVKVDFFLFGIRQDFNRFYLTNFGFPSPSHSVYKQNRNAVYLTLSNLTTGVIAHEMGHLVICTYSPVPPPVNAQEIMCQYLDLHIQQKSFSGLIVSESLGIDK